jgi:hypothetical protein
LRFTGWAILLAAIGGLVFLGYRAYPAHQPSKKNPNFIDVIFGNNLVVFAARVVLFATAVVLAITAFYVVYSMVQRIRAGHLLSQFGPLRVQEVEDLSGQVDYWQSAWSELDAENDFLRARLEQTDAIVEQLLGAGQTETGTAETEGDEEEPPSW